MMMMTVEATTAVGFLSGRAPVPEELVGVHVSSRRAGSVNLERNRLGRIRDGRCLARGRRWMNRTRTRACSGSGSGPGSDPPPPPNVNGRTRYHPFEEIAESAAEEIAGDGRLTPQETARTVVEGNSKAALMLTGLFADDIHQNIIWPDLAYVTDEHGNVYFQVKNDEDILPTLTSPNNFVQAIVGFDTMEMLSEMELLGSSEIDFGIEEIEVEGSIEDDDDDDEEEEDDEDNEDEDQDEDYDEDYEGILEDEEDDDDLDETLGDWAKLETMRSSHPMYFAKKLTQAATDDPIDWMEQPSAGLVLQGLIRPAFIEEHSDIQRHMSRSQSNYSDANQAGENIEGKLEDLKVVSGEDHKLGSSKDGPEWSELENAEAPRSGTSFYKLEIIKIQLISAHGTHTAIEVEDFKKAQPDAIALSAAKIISRVKAVGEKMTEALKSLCWRCKGIQVEETALIAIDSLGFDLRVCSGTQIQTLRFTFNSRATSEYGAEKQLNDLLFPRIHHKQPKKKQTHQK